uniref:B30.2/SPRY domain-containing protein n=1 Tax=Cynoglossus semilaevis TaxID=244447 RepID=A0A3P8V2G1_CYNSE
MRLVLKASICPLEIRNITFIRHQCFLLHQRKHNRGRPGSPSNSDVSMKSDQSHQPEHCNNKLSWCELSEESCKGLNLSVLCSASSNLTKLDLSHNDLLDSGVEQLAEGLKSVHCKLKSLNLAGCQVTEKGCGYIASALEFRKAADLKMLDLSYNHPGDIESKRLQDITEDPQMKLKTLWYVTITTCVDSYEVYLTFDEKTAHRKFAFENGRKVKTIDLSKKAARGTASVNKDMVRWTQVFCERPEMPNQGLTGLCYWEMEWTGQVAIALAYEKVGRDMSHFGSLICSKISWSLSCSHKNYTARHGNTSVTIETEPCPRIGVFLDYDNGLLSFYSVTPGQLSHIYTFNEKFTRPLFPGFSFKKVKTKYLNSSVSLSVSLTGHSKKM